MHLLKRDRAATRALRLSTLGRRSSLPLTRSVYCLYNTQVLSILQVLYAGGLFFNRRLLGFI